MKKLALIMTSLILSASVFASEPAQASSDSDVTSKMAQLCMAAVESKDALREKAIEFKMTRKEVNQVRCNDMRINEFARNYRDLIEDRAIANIQ